MNESGDSAPHLFSLPTGPDSGMCIYICLINVDLMVGLFSVPQEFRAFAILGTMHKPQAAALVSLMEAKRLQVPPTASRATELMEGPYLS